MKRRIMTVALAVFLLWQALPSQASAVGDFTPVRTYRDQFSDISGTDWYYDSVKFLYELGLTSGKGAENIFDPKGDIAVSEVITMAARLRSLWETGDSESGPSAYMGASWYTPYVTYLQDAGAIGRELEGGYTRPATRAEMAHVLAGALPSDRFDPINEEVVRSGWQAGQYIKDVTGNTRYRDDILRLYSWGITGGSDAMGTFHPEDNISRCEAAAMVARLASGGQRLSLDWEILPAYSKKGTTMPDLIQSDGAFYDAPSLNEPEKIDADVRYMLSRGERIINLKYPAGSLSTSYADELTEAFLNAARNYVEQTYNYVQVSYSTRTGVMTMTFGSSLYPENQIDYYRDETMAYALSVHDHLWETGQLNSGMTDYEKARVYFTWICEYCRYDHTSADMSHSAYRLFKERIAVCDGYTAAYNLLLKLEDIDCGTYSTIDHIWTIAELDGKTYHIDTTWGDQSSQVDYRYFAMTPTEAISRF